MTPGPDEHDVPDVPDVPDGLDRGDADAGERAADLGDPTRPADELGSGSDAHGPAEDTGGSTRSANDLGPGADDIDDVALLGLVVDGLDDGGPAPTDLLRLAVDAAWQLRRIDAVVARLVADVTADAVAVRGERPGRFLTFALGDVTLELDLRPDGTTVVGQLLPAEQLAVTAVTGGETEALPVDDLGRFRVLHGAPLLVLRVETATGTFVTPPIRH